ncbi:hypothetical protein J5Y09_21630 [Roseomonas sp. PWR1]|uniref:Sporulation protein YjcZ n=1 Tax=Roseomonas nitratireducens TaxID=2820810 RepID=A0ABS4AYV2_9PROT|nr:hypothetical protein [Neoroseomonas nitratireducens]MBP0466545.1 hypothetical protein [Neoroseomonas nitratireducens]
MHPAFNAPMAGRFPARGNFFSGGDRRGAQPSRRPRVDGGGVTRPEDFGAGSAAGRDPSGRHRGHRADAGAEGAVMNNIVYIVGAVVIVLFILGALGFR